MLRQFVLEQVPSMLKSNGVRSSDRIGVVLPSRPEAGVCILACMTWACCAPLDAQVHACIFEHVIFDIANDITHDA